MRNDTDDVTIWVVYQTMTGHTDTSYVSMFISSHLNGNDAVFKVERMNALLRAGNKDELIKLDESLSWNDIEHIREYDYSSTLLDLKRCREDKS